MDQVVKDYWMYGRFWFENAYLKIVPIPPHTRPPTVPVPF